MSKEITCFKLQTCFRLQTACARCIVLLMHDGMARVYRLWARTRGDQRDHRREDVAASSDAKLDRILELVQSFDGRLAGVESLVRAVDGRLTETEGGVKSALKQVEALKLGMHTMTDNYNEITARLSSMEKALAGFQAGSSAGSVGGAVVAEELSKADLLQRESVIFMSGWT